MRIAPVGSFSSFNSIESPKYSEQRENIKKREAIKPVNLNPQNSSIKRAQRTGNRIIYTRVQAGVSPQAGKQAFKTEKTARTGG